jgi:hypothetical protein
VEPPEETRDAEDWDAADDVEREQVLQLARRLAEQRERQRTDDLVELDELKRALRERAADVAQRELEVERRLRELEEAGETEPPRRAKRFRRGGRRPEPEAPGADAVDDRLRSIESRERSVGDRESSLRAREAELGRRERELALKLQPLAAERRELDELARSLAARAAELDRLQQAAAKADVPVERDAAPAARERELRDREAELLRLQEGLAAQQESIRRRERAVENAERALARESAAPAAHLTFSEGLDVLTGSRRRRA